MSTKHRLAAFAQCERRKCYTPLIRAVLKTKAGKAGWENKFDKKFFWDWEKQSSTILDQAYKPIKGKKYLTVANIKQFISSELSRREREVREELAEQLKKSLADQRREWRENIEGMKILQYYVELGSTRLQSDIRILKEMEKP